MHLQDRRRSILITRAPRDVLQREWTATHFTPRNVLSESKKILAL
jgi:hypothetical protein